ncbi:MAG: ribosome biogenesis GTP-binding protein YihA/YsxC [Lachnospiraceae bacterium]|nr:ribosome biogenesis GTP-binding protein YihA/YsxC [Lachnospiraceae bacterium]
MVIKNVSLETVIGVKSKIPENQLPELVFAGKSNVGKSSLINSLMNRKSLARISAQPGKTQTINYYNINQELYFVDLPGYGYAKVSLEEKQRWGKMVERYLRTSKQIRAVFLLTDIRHEPSANDRQMYEWILSNGYHPIIVATKLDKIKRSQLQKHLRMISKGLGADKQTILIPFSASSNQGRDEIYALIDRLMSDAGAASEGTGKEEL